MQTGWEKVGGTWYYLNPSGAMRTGWIELDDTWYYLYGSGAMATGWTQVGGTWYYMWGSGAMQEGPCFIGGKGYYFRSNGSWRPSDTQAQRLSLAKEEAGRVVDRIIEPGMSQSEKARAIIGYVFWNTDQQLDQSNAAYSRNYGNEAFAALCLHKAACSGYCKAVTLLCDEAGLQSRHINANTWQHQWNEIKIDGTWYKADSQLGVIYGLG